MESNTNDQKKSCPLTSKTNRASSNKEETTKTKEKKNCVKNKNKVSIKKLITNKKITKINPFYTVNLKKRQRRKNKIEKIEEHYNIDTKKMKNILSDDSSSLEKLPIECIHSENLKEASTSELKYNFESITNNAKNKNSNEISVQHNDLFMESNDILTIKNVKIIFILFKPQKIKTNFILRKKMSRPIETYILMIIVLVCIYGLCITI